MQLGAFQIEPIRAGVFKLDGGAMFGVVPRVLWAKLVPPDEQNRVPMALNCLLVKTPNHTVLVETGIGDKFDSKWRDIYAIEGRVRLDDHLSALSVGPADVDYVVCTHLHFDHAGGCTQRAGDGSPAPVFLRARHVVREEEWDDSLSPDPRSRASYRRENLDPLAGAGLLSVIHRDCEVVPGVTVEKTGGHTRGHQTVKITSDGRTICFVGDILPTQHHVKAAYTPSYDVFPLDTMAARERILARAKAEGWLLALPHSVDAVFWRVVEGEGGLELKRAAEDEQP